jgi:prepilin-type N-terminal cleavage/methylation domain-containing protein
MKSSLSRPQRGFTLAEALVTLAILAIAMALGAPALQRLFLRSSLEATGREMAVLFQRARLEAIKRRVPTVVEVDPSTGSVRAFADVDGPAAADPPDLLFNPVAGELRFDTDYEIGVVRAGSHVSFAAPAGEAVAEGLTAAAGRRVAVFLPTGGVDRAGGFRLGDPGGRNHLEVRVDPAGTGRIALRKWDRDAQEWYAHREGGRPWIWYSGP